MINFPPGLILIAASLLVALPLVKGSAKALIGLLSAVACLICVFLTYGGVGACSVTLIDSVALAAPFGGGDGLSLQLMQLNAPTRIFATIFSLMACMGLLFALNQGRPVELCGALLYAGAAICVTYVGDLLSLFIFWELMAVGSTLVVLDGGQNKSSQAGLRYAAVHFLGGVLLMAGIIWYGAMEGNSLLLPADPLAADNALVAFATALEDPAAWLMLIGVLINAGAPLLGAWLPDAYPEASPSGTVFLSAFTTKTAVFVLMMLFAGADILIWIGIIMAIYGIVYAVLENDMRRMLAYSIINQVGFMVCAVGIGTQLALCGVAAHAFVHIMYKALLMMSAGSVLYMTGKRKCTELGGLYQSMRWTTICGIIGAVASLAVPLTAGFATKSMITTAAAESASVADDPWTYIIAWFVLIAASAAVCLHSGIKYPWFVFFQKDSGMRPADPPWNMKWAMVIFAVLCIGFGLPGVPKASIYQILPYTPMKVSHEHGHADHTQDEYAGPAQADGQVSAGAVVDHGYAELVPYSTWSWNHVITQCALLLASALAFFLLLGLLKRTLTITLDSDWVYRKLLPQTWWRVVVPLLRWPGKLHNFILEQLPSRVARAVFARRIEHQVQKEIELGGSKYQLLFKMMSNRTRQWAVGGAMIVITAMLLLYVVVNLF